MTLILTIMQTYRLLSLLQLETIFLLECIFAFLLNSFFCIQDFWRSFSLPLLLHVSPVNARKFATQEGDMHTCCSPWIRRLCGALRSSELLMVCCALFHRQQHWDVLWKAWVVLILREWIITKHAATAATQKLLWLPHCWSPPRDGPRSLHTRLTQNTSHHSWEAGTSCFITRHETDFFQL